MRTIIKQKQSKKIQYTYRQREIELFVALKKRWKFGEIVAAGKFRRSKSLRSSIVRLPGMETVSDSPARVLILISLSVSSITSLSLKLFSESSLYRAENLAGNLVVYLPCNVT